MKAIAIGLFSLLSLGALAQEIDEEFLPINVEGKEAFMSTKTGEFTFREHAKTNPEQLKTTASGVVYTDITNHLVKKGETLFTIAKKNGLSIAEIKQYNKDVVSNLKIGSSLKIVKKLLVKSSSPVISYVGKERVIAALRPGESPGQFAPPPSVAEVESNVIKTERTQEKPAATVYKAETSIKNPVFGLNTENTDDDDTSIKSLSEAVKSELAEAKTETVIEAPKQKVKVETKKEKLARLKAEMKTLEEELEVEAIASEAKEEEVKPRIIEIEKPSIKTETVNTADYSKAIERIKETNPEVEIKETASGDKVMVFENKSKIEKSTAEKAKEAIASVRKTEKLIEVSKAEAIAKEKEDASKSNSEENKTTYHTVVKGNSLWYIANKYNMTVDALKKMNNLKNNNLDIGQKLKVIPKK